MNDESKAKSKWYWRLSRRVLITMAVLATLVAALVTEEDWRGKRDLEEYRSADLQKVIAGLQKMRDKRVGQDYRRESEALAESPDLDSIIPPPVPDDQNFFAAPIVAAALKAEREGSNSVNPLKFHIERGDSALWPANGGNWQKGALTDLKQWQTYFRTYNASAAGRTNGFPLAAQPRTPAADILRALSGYGPALEELRLASQRRYARMPINYEAGFADVAALLPWLATEKNCARLVVLRVQAELQEGQSQAALDDVKLLLRLSDSLRGQPFLISHLVRIAMQAITLQPIYEGLAQHRWNDEQLAGLETALAGQDFLADYKSAMRGERTMAIATFEAQRLTRQMESDSGETGEVVTNSLRWMPSAYFYQNELAFARMYEQDLAPLVDVTNHMVFVDSFRHMQEAMSGKRRNHFSPYTAQAQMSLPAISRSVVKFAVIQGDVDLARVACALERYRLARGEYPEALSALAPQFIAQLPHDLINGQPLHYHSTDDGKFILYSIGWNEKDDGGAVALTKGGYVNLEQGDWVWKY